MQSKSATLNSAFQTPGYLIKARAILLGALIMMMPLCSISQADRVLSADSLRNDLIILKTTLQENHPLLFTYISKGRFDSLANDIHLQINSGVTALQFYVLVNKLLSQLGCGHTYAYPIADIENRMRFTNDLPFDVSIHDEAVYIAKVYNSHYKNYLGGEIKRINSVPVADVLNYVKEVVPADGYNTTYKYFQLQHLFNYYLNLALNNPASLVFELTGDSFVINFPTGFVKRTEEEPESGFYEVAGNTKTVVLTLADFDGGRHLIRKCFKLMAKKQSENLVVDLRNNGGGNGNIGALLTSFIVDSTTTYYLDKRTAFIRYREHFRKTGGILISNRYVVKDSATRSYYFSVHPRKKYHFNGRVYVLINGGTFSTAAYVASVLKYKTRSTFVGEETGGSEYGIGGGTMGRLTLPYSQLNIKFPMYNWRFNTTDIQSGTGVIPAIKATNAPGDSLITGDKQLDIVIDLINKSYR